MIVLKATQDKVLAVLQSVSGIVERQTNTELNQQLHVLEQTLKG